MPSSDECFVQSAFEVMERLDTLQSEQLLGEAVAGIVSQTGFDQFVVTRLPHIRERLGPYMMLKRWPDHWLNHYDRNKLYAIDPVAHRCMTQAKPFLWSEVVSETPAAERVMREAESHGLRCGLTVPLFDAEGFKGAVSMSGMHVELPPRSRKALHFLSIYAYEAAERLHRGRPQRHSHVLTDREREVLRWIAIGKTAWEIGEILCIAESTVKNHLCSVRSKLSTTNTTHSVVQALRLREIRM